MQWTPEQQAVLGHSPGISARILAGPGTGKSATIVEWIGQLLAGTSPPSVKLLTFTRAATSELTRKVADYPATATLQPSTVHSFSILVLLRNPGVAAFPVPLRIADDWERTQIIYPSLGRRIGVQPRRISRLFTELAANWEALEERPDDRIEVRDRDRFLGAWQEHRHALGYTLLSELPWALRRAIQNHPTLEGADYDLLVVDEYQDLNACDLSVLRLLADRGSTIVAVGDDDQSIYSFRRAAPEGIRRFSVDYPGSGDYPLSITHRCGTRIMDWAASVIARDTSRDAARAMPTPADGSPEGEVALLAFLGQSSEPAGIAELVDHLINDEGVEPSQILILLRSDHNSQFSKPIKHALTERGIEVADPDTVGEQLAIPANRRLMAACRLLVNQADSLAWATLLHHTSGIGDTFFDWVYARARERGVQFGDALLAAHAAGFNGAPRSSAAADEVVSHVLEWREQHPIPDNPPEGGWGHWMIGLTGSELIPEVTPDFAAILEGVDELARGDEEFGRYLGQLTPLARDHAQAVSSRVRLMTMAASKGLTVEATIIAAAEEGVTPSRKPDTDANEECRLLYVAMTRSKRYLFCTWARRRTGPTARAGRGQAAELRNPSSFFDNGPVASQDGPTFIQRRWPSE